MQDMQILATKPDLCQFTGLTVFHQDIGKPGEGAQPLSVRCVIEVEGDALLAAIEIGEGKAAVRA